MHHTYTTHSEQEFLRVAESIIRAQKTEKAYLLSGPLGSGKTTFVKAAARFLGATEIPHSPTFSLLNEYTLASKKTWQRIYHLDLYRVKTKKELEPLELQDLFYDTQSLLFIEWPDAFLDFFSAWPYCHITFSVKGDVRMIDVRRKS